MRLIIILLRSRNANHRKGGLIGLAATAIGLYPQVIPEHNVSYFPPDDSFLVTRCKLILLRFLSPS